MASVFSNKNSIGTIVDRVLWYYAIVLVVLMVTGTIRDNSLMITSSTDHEPLILFRVGGGGGGSNHPPFLTHRPCDEIYVVREGETLQTISDKCGDPFIVEKNPHIHFSWLVIKITPPS